MSSTATQVATNNRFIAQTAPAHSDTSSQYSKRKPIPSSLYVDTPNSANAPSSSPPLKPNRRLSSPPVRKRTSSNPSRSRHSYGSSRDHDKLHSALYQLRETAARLSSSEAEKKALQDRLTQSESRARTRSIDSTTSTALLQRQAAEIRTAQEAARLYQLKLENAERDLQIAHTAVRSLEDSCEDAEKEAKKARSVARKLRTEREVWVAREEGWVRGLEEGRELARELLVREGFGSGFPRIMPGFREDDGPEAFIEEVEDEAATAHSRRRGVGMGFSSDAGSVGANDLGHASSRGLRSKGRSYHSVSVPASVTRSDRRRRARANSLDSRGTNPTPSRSHRRPETVPSEARSVPEQSRKHRQRSSTPKPRREDRQAEHEPPPPPRSQPSESARSRRDGRDRVASAGRVKTPVSHDRSETPRDQPHRTSHTRTRDVDIGPQDRTGSTIMAALDDPMTIRAFQEHDHHSGPSNAQLRRPLQNLDASQPMTNPQFSNNMSFAGPANPTSQSGTQQPVTQAVPADPPTNSKPNPALPYIPMPPPPTSAPLHGQAVPPPLSLHGAVGTGIAAAMSATRPPQSQNIQAHQRRPSSPGSMDSATGTAQSIGGMDLLSFPGTAGSASGGRSRDRSKNVLDQREAELRKRQANQAEDEERELERRKLDLERKKRDLDNRELDNRERALERRERELSVIAESDDRSSIRSGVGSRRGSARGVLSLRVPAAGPGVEKRRSVEEWRQSTLPEARNPLSPITPTSPIVRDYGYLAPHPQNATNLQRRESHTSSTSNGTVPIRIEPPSGSTTPSVHRRSLSGGFGVPAIRPHVSVPPGPGEPPVIPFGPISASSDGSFGPAPVLPGGSFPVSGGSPLPPGFIPAPMPGLRSPVTPSVPFPQPTIPNIVPPGPGMYSSPSAAGGSVTGGQPIRRHTYTPVSRPQSRSGFGSSAPGMMTPRPTYVPAPLPDGMEYPPPAGATPPVKVMAPPTRTPPGMPVPVIPGVNTPQRRNTSLNPTPSSLSSSLPGASFPVIPIRDRSLRRTSRRRRHTGRESSSSATSSTRSSSSSSSSGTEDDNGIDVFDATTARNTIANARNYTPIAPPVTLPRR